MENSWYHVMNRGIDARRLFPDNKANEHFRELLARMPTRFGLRIHAYVLMDNHYHLQIETLRPNLSRAIQWLNLSFVRSRFRLSYLLSIYDASFRCLRIGRT